MKDIPSIADVLKDISKKYDVRVGALGDVTEDVVALTTGNLAIDYVTGVNGLPLGRSVELFGPPSCGKTTTALQTAAALQQRILAEGSDEYILYADYEHALDEMYCAALGLDVSHPSVILIQPDTLEQGANAAIRLIETGKVRLSIWDSVAAMTPSAILTEEVGKVSVAVRARLMSNLLVKLNPLLHAHRCCAVFLNHEMDVLEVGGRPGIQRTTTPGGKALKYYSSVRINYKQIKNVKGTVQHALSATSADQVAATHVKVKVVKNKVAPPFRECDVRVRFGKGFDNFFSAIQVLTAHKKVVAGNVGHVYFDEDKVPSLIHPDMQLSSTGRPFIRGEARLISFADSHPEWRAMVIKQAVEVVQQHGGDALESGDLRDDERELPPGTLLDEAGT